MCAAKNSIKRGSKSKKLKKFASLCSEETLDQEYRCVQRGRSAEQLGKLNAEPEFNKDLTLQDLDDEIFFPYDASQRLSQQVEVLLEENRRLRGSLVEAEARLRGVVTKCPAAMGSHGRASDLAASKIVELSKRVRELTADLEVARMRCRSFELSTSLAAANAPANESATEKEQKPEDVASKGAEIKELAEKLSSANLKVCEYRNQCQQMKHELKLAQKALVSEVGEGVSVASVVSGGGGGWRGRAQTIQTLQQRIAELSEKTANPELAEKEAKKAVSAARSAERELRASHEREVSALRAQLDERQRKVDAARARAKVLESTAAEQRGRIATLLQKTQHDDQLITALNAQVSCCRGKEHSANDRMEQTAKTLEQQLAEEKLKFSNLQCAFNEKEQELEALVNKLCGLPVSIDRELDKARCPSTESILNPAVETVGVAAEAERLRLLELLAVNNRRLEQERLLATQAHESLRKERQKAARLETKLARQELERVERVSAKPSYLNLGPPASARASEAAVEEFKSKIQLLEEEVLFLRSRLANVELEKRDDLRSYSDMLDDARRLFLQAVKHTNHNQPLPNATHAHDNKTNVF